MATVTNPTNWNLFSHVLRANVPPKTTISGVDQALADEACRTNVFILGEDEVVKDEEDGTPIRKSRSQRGSKEVEEAVEPERETR